jgi:quercetin 2,3-dioxygenase
MSHAPVHLHPAASRGHVDHGWLKSAHTFSFADYHEPKMMGFRSLRVINDDRVAGGAGFGRHPHRDMEIFSYVLRGALEHKDSLGNGRVLKPGQIQLMSAGTGVFHSEFNPLADQEAAFLQIWILPRKTGLAPSYTEWHPTAEHASMPKVLVISPDGRDNSAVIQQDADVYRIRLKKGESVSHEVLSGRGVWLQVAAGGGSINGHSLQSGDGVRTEAPGVLEIASDGEMEALLFDLG